MIFIDLVLIFVICWIVIDKFRDDIKDLKNQLRCAARERVKRSRVVVVTVSDAIEMLTDPDAYERAGFFPLVQNYLPATSQAYCLALDTLEILDDEETLEDLEPALARCAAYRQYCQLFDSWRDANRAAERLEALVFGNE